MTESSRSSPDPDRRRVPILAALTAGAILGAMVLGGGGRLAMRAITLWEDRAHLFSVVGTFTVAAWGAAFGAAAAALRFALEATFNRWLPERTTESSRALIFAVICLALAIIVLTPLTMHRLVLFPPVVALYLLTLEVFWRRQERVA